jgi:tRNA nucleotidyltransferase (CCA-adding enzyme)
MNIIVGHTNMDLDCFGSMVLARYLHPGYTLVASKLIHPVAKHLFNLYQNHLNMVFSKELRETTVEHMIILDTRTYARVKEYFENMEGPPARIDIYDHHTEEKCDIPNAVIHGEDYGSNTTLLGLSCVNNSAAVGHEDATIALAGIYADTGNFTHENVKEEDFSVAAYLARQGGSVKLVKEFLKTLKDDHQITLFHEMLNRVSYQDIHGHFIIATYVQLDKQVGGLAAVVEKVFEVENTDAIFAVFGFKKEGDTIIIGRSQKPTIDIHKALKHFGGGGHAAAGSALIKKTEGEAVFRDLLERLHENLLPAIMADQIMTTGIGVILDTWTLLEASLFLEKINHSGAPVVDSGGKLAGFMTLKDIMKGRKSGQMHAPVKAYMARKLITGKPNATIREIEQLLYKNNIGHLPVVEGGRPVGIITRSDYLRFMQKTPL